MSTTKLARGVYRRESGRLLVAWRQGGRFCRYLMPRGATLTEAKEYRQIKLGEAASGRPVIAGRLTFADLLKLLPHPARRPLREAWPATTLARDITTSMVRAWEAARLAAGKARSTVNGDLADLRHAFKLAVEAKLVAEAPVIKTPTPNNARRGFFEAEAFGRVVERLPAWARPVVRFLYHTGWRVGSRSRERGETLKLRWKVNVDWRAGVVRLEPGTTKNREGREFPFAEHPALRALLEQQLAAAEPVSAEHVFFMPSGGPIPYKKLRLAFRAACRKAKCPGLILHDLRRTAVRNLVRAGVQQVVAMQLTGHRTTSVFHRYAIVDTTLLREGVAKLAAVSER